MEINNELRDRAYQCVCKHGFHDVGYSDEHWLMLIITEISEAVDADRKGKHANKEYIEEELTNLESKGYFIRGFDYLIKGSVEEELADIVIRCLDLAGLKGIDINSPEHDFMEDSISFNESMFLLCKTIFYTQESYPLMITIKSLLSMTLCIAKYYNIDLLYHIEQKMKYNELRPMLNGKNY